jgi:hypothetical protein
MEYTNDNEIYEPVEPTYYEYKAINNLDKNIDNLLKNNKITTIHICAFEINNEAKNPFLKFFLYKNEYNDVLNFLSLDFNDFLTDTNLVELNTKMYLYNYLNLNNFNSFSETINYKGGYIENKKLYMFYDLTNCKLQINDIYSDSKMWICLVDEILNENKVCSFNVDKDVIDFLINNLDFCFLYDKNNEKYNLPIAGYVVKEDKLLNFTYTFGVSKSNNNNNIFGSHYYFTNYDNVIKKLDILRNEIKETSNKKVGIVRFALFLEYVKFIDSYSNSKLKISDYNNLLTNTYDSIFLGNNIEFENGEMLNDVPLIVLKNYEQQNPLSYHYINKFNKII